jgi:outer membrane autotransporter protein
MLVAGFLFFVPGAAMADSNITLAVTTNRTTYAAAGTTIVYTYTITKIVTGPESGIEEILLTDSRLGPIACPRTTILGEEPGTLTCRKTYVTTGADVRRGAITSRATVNALTRVHSDSAPIPVSATTRVTVSFSAPPPPKGSVKIIVKSIGGDAKFSIASEATDGGLTLATSDGVAQHNFGSLAPGHYSFTETLPSGWHLASLTCAGDRGGRSTTVNVNAAQAKVGLDPNEAITCTFVNSRRNVHHTHHTITRFLEDRLALLLEGPDRARLVRRASGSLWQGGSPEPFSLTGATTDTSSNLNFSTSLLRVAADRSTARAQAGAAAPKSWTAADPGFDVWVEGHYRSFHSDFGNADGAGHNGIVYLGADYLIGSDALIGALVQYDWMSISEAGAGVRDKTSGRGVMAGRYASLRLGQQLFLDGRLAWGTSHNSDSPTNTFSDDFSTSRWLGHLQITANWQLDAYRVTPSLALDYGEEHQHAFTDTAGARIPAQTVALGRLSFGPEIARRFVTAGGMVYEPMVSLTGQWNFERSALFDMSGAEVNPNPLSLKAQAGLIAVMPNGASARAAISYDGVGSSSFHSVGGELSLNVPLH